MSDFYRNRVKAAQEVFSSCPVCTDSDLIFCDDEAICTACGWDSIALRVEASFDRLNIPIYSDDHDAQFSDSTMAVLRAITN